MAKFLRQLVFLMWRYYTPGFHFGTIIQHGNLSERRTGYRDKLNMDIQLATCDICVDEVIVLLFQSLKQ